MSLWGERTFVFLLRQRSQLLCTRWPLGALLDAGAGAGAGGCGAANSAISFRGQRGAARRDQTTLLMALAATQWAHAAHRQQSGEGQRSMVPSSGEETGAEEKGSNSRVHGFARSAPGSFSPAKPPCNTCRLAHATPATPFHCSARHLLPTAGLHTTPTTPS